jgi:16S rRNA (cytosine967-C5)-methyltransferase
MSPRQRALYILLQVLDKKRSLREVFPKYSEGLSDVDRSFLQELIYGVLRKLLYLDWRIGQYLARPEGLRSETIMNLRVGAYQILFMRVPDWAAVNETVKVEKRTGRNPNVVNAVLRRIVDQRDDPPLPQEPVKRLSITTSHPEWLVRRWMNRFGPTEAERLMNINNTMAPITLRVNTLRTTRTKIIEHLRSRGIEAHETEHSPVGITITGRCPFDILRQLMGAVMVQDEAAQLITMLLEPEPGQRILDACAAPGGKTAFIIELTGGKASLVAVDMDSERVALLRDNLRAAGYQGVDIIKADIRRLSFGIPFHRIILDAPCSSLGVIRRNPDVRYRYGEKDLKVFKQRQIELLSSVSKYLLPEGILVYSVCSFEPEETLEVVEEFLNKNGDFIIIKSTGEIHKPFVDEKGYFFTFPQRDKMDGHFGVRLTRR